MVPTLAEIDTAPPGRTAVPRAGYLIDSARNFATDLPQHRSAAADR